MKAIQIQSAGKITSLDNAPIPEPKPGEILVKCIFAALRGSNIGSFTSDGLYDNRYPNPIGCAFGVIEMAHHD